MSQYKCIICGKIKESDNICSCPDCGYKMFPLPYDKNETLKSEIKYFLKNIQLSKVDRHLLIFKGKTKDDGRFPGFNGIQNYACSAKKTEVFIERINQSLDQLRKHVEESFTKDYEVDATALQEVIEKRNSILVEAFKELKKEISISSIELPKTKLHYNEVPDDRCFDLTHSLIDELCRLSEKINKFIRLNNVYGDTYKSKGKAKFKVSDIKNEDKNPDDLLMENAIADLENGIKLVQKTNAKEYVIDFFDDGTEQLGEMLKVFWRGIDILYTVPYAKKKYEYIIDEQILSETDYSNLICKTYKDNIIDINQLIEDDNLLASYNENELVDLYNIMIELDEYNVLDINKNNIINVGEAEKQLNKLIGLSPIKQSIQKIKAYAFANKGSKDLNLHMCFYGNPGTGKTEVARIIAGILYENKILPTKNVVEVSREDLVAAYVGQTPIKTMMKIDQAMGGVLFIDEAYSLAIQESPGDYGHEAIATLIKAMEDRRGKFCVILAGYKNPMIKLLDTNPGFKSRIQFELDFPNYSREELGQIAKLMLDKKSYLAEQPVMNRMLDIADVRRKDPNFANAREIRNILDQVIMCQNLRVLNREEKELGIVDVNKYIKDANIPLPIDKDTQVKKILTGEEELDQLIGLKSIKKTIRKIKAYAKRNKDNANLNLHMCFYGNPGTGKTEVARILSRILYDAGVLSEAKVIETDAFGLIGKYVGETGPKTKAKIEEAMGGVLFIDEAYALVASRDNSNYGDEAIAVLLKEMEDRRGKFCTILAGYKNEMQNLIAKNPGFDSRLQFKLDFPDYTREELSDIALMMAKKQGYTIDEDALSRILDITDFERDKPNYANARNVRNILDQVILNQNLRTEDLDESNDVIILEDVEDYIDENELDIPKSTIVQSNTNIDCNNLIDVYRNTSTVLGINEIEQCIVSISNRTSQGTGFIISPDGYVVTCSHCIEGDGSSQQARISIMMADGQKMQIYNTFDVLKKDEKNDVAILKLRPQGIQYRFLKLSQTYDYAPLSDFMMAGYPFGGEAYQTVSFTTGKIASINYLGDRKVVFADMFGKPGNSGSPVIDTNTNEVIGIYWGGISKGIEMINCFTPVDLIWDLIK